MSHESEARPLETSVGEVPWAAAPHVGLGDDGGSGGASAIAVSVRATGLTEATCERAVSFRGSVPRTSRSTQGCALSCGVP